MTRHPLESSPEEERSKQLLALHGEQTRNQLSTFFDDQGISLPILAVALEQCMASMFKLPQEAACKEGCGYCCHLRVGVSIPEVVVIFNALATHSPAQGFATLKQRVQTLGNKGDTLADAFWLETRSPCPFLDDQNRCLIYHLRPFSCRAYNSTDLTACEKSYEQGVNALIPCFSLFRAVTEMISTALTKVLADKGFFAYQVGFVKALGILMNDPKVADQWLNREDVFSRAKLTSSL